MKQLASISAFLLFSLTIFSQSVRFEQKFNEGLLFLGTNKLGKATIIFEDLYASDTTNLNLAYLLGQCYARKDVKLEKAITLLKRSTKAYTPEYRKRDYSERRVSEYAFYYLLMAYSGNGDCDKTLNALNDFYKIYSYDNEWYLVDAQKLHRDCEPKEEEETKETPLLTTEPTPTQKPKERVPYQPNTNHIIGTKSVQYTDKSAAWGVQVGAFLEPVFTYEFKGLRNVEVYVDNNGIYRYVIGRFAYKVQADKLLNLIHEEGYNDAFITNVKDMNKFSEEVITIDNESVHKQIVGRVDYRVQIGAFRGDTVPNELMQVYLKLDSISQYQHGELTLMTVGSFDSYDEANFYRELVQDIGVTDAFVTAWNYQRKVDLKQAKIYLEEQAKKREERKEAELNNQNKSKRK